MAEEYKQLTLKERKEIEEGLTRGDSFRRIAGLIGRSPSTVSREVRVNRHVRAFKQRKFACRDRNWCKRVAVCAQCLREGAYCAGCDARDCRDHCKAYADQAACDVLVSAPWVCNGCRKNRYGCHRQNRYVYDARVAQKSSDGRRSDSRKGIDMGPERAGVALSHIKDGLSRGLSPYEISVLYADVVGVHRSTIYRWVDAGYGGLANLELERKVGFRPRRKAARKTTSHSPKRSHAEFDKLPKGLRESRTELDCVVGRNVDRQAALTIYNLPCHMQLALLLDSHDCANVKKELADVRSAMPAKMHSRWMRICLTDNGEEFGDEDGIGELLGERIAGGELQVGSAPVLLRPAPIPAEWRLRQEPHGDPPDPGEGHVRLRRAHAGRHGSAHEPRQLEPPRGPRGQVPHTDAAVRLWRRGRGRAARRPRHTRDRPRRAGAQARDPRHRACQAGRASADAPEVGSIPKQGRCA